MILKSPLSKGIWLMIISWSLFATMNAVAKHTCNHVSFTVSLFFQNSIALCLLSPLFFRGGFSLFKTQNKKLLLSRAVVGVLVFVCLFFSLSVIPLTDALLLANTGPLFLPFVLYVWLKQKTSPRTWLTITIGFLGVLSIVRPSSEIFHYGAIFALLSGCLTGIGMVVVNQLALEDSRRVVLFYLITATLCSLPLALPNLSSIPLKTLPYLLLVGTLFGLGQWAYTRALIYADATVLAPFSYIFIIVGVFIDWLIWNRIPSLGTLLGVILIVTGGILTIRWSKSSAEHATASG